MKKFFWVFFFVLGAGMLCFTAVPARALTVAPEIEQPQYFSGTIKKIISPSLEDFGPQQMEIFVTNGALRRQTVTATAEEISGRQAATFSVGMRVVVAETIADDGARTYAVVERYRVPALVGITALFFACAVFFGRRKGLQSILGLGVTVAALAVFIVPQIADGKNPLVISLIGALIIAVVSLYFSHGFERRTSVALLGTICSLAIAAVLSLLFVGWATLFGTGSEEALFLETGAFGTFNLRGLLLGAIIIGALGVLDDVTTAQSATVEELANANPSFSFSELYRRGLSVGREHIASLVNTLVLAYASVSLPLFLLFRINRDQPLWVTLNSEFIAEEIVRTLVGSTALIFAVPITTLIAALVCARKSAK
ncbi:MAG: YibE/F family protein [bacterium]|nr:YibE/F family protein [bacterium]